MTDEAGVRGSAFFVAVSAVTHLHRLPGILVYPGDVGAPDIPRVFAYVVFFVNWRFILIFDRAMAALTIDSSLIDVDNMGKEDAGWLFGINQPVNLLDALGYEFFKES
jgi:hypothetical protein